MSFALLLSLARGSARRLVFALGVAALALSIPTTAYAAPVSTTGGFESFGGSPGQNNTTLCLDVFDAGSQTPGPGTPLDSYFCSGVPGQHFTLVTQKVVDGYTVNVGPMFELRADAGSNLCVAIPGGVYNGSPATLEPCNWNANEQWDYYDGTLHYFSSNEQYCLDVNGAHKSPSTKVDLATCNGTIAQIWWPWGYTVQISRAPRDSVNLCLDDFADLDVDGGRVDSGTCNGTNAQIWQFDGSDVIQNVNQEVLQAQAPDSTGTGVVDLARSFNGSYGGNYWTMAYSPTGYGVEFINWGYTSNGQPACLDVYGDSPAPNTTVDLYQCNGTNAQAWDISL